MRRLRLRGLSLPLVFAILAAGPAAALDESEAEKAAREDGAAKESDPAAVAADAAKAFEEFRTPLENLCHWCSGFELMLERSRLAEILLSFDPDHAKAREWLGFKKQKNGSWKPPAYRVPVNARAEGLAEFGKRRAALAETYRARMLPLLDRCTAWQTVGLRGRIVRSLVTLIPDDAVLRAMHGEVLVGGKWLLRESAETAANRVQLTAAVAEARTAAARANVVVTANTPNHWACEFKTADFRILSDLTPAETKPVMDGILAGAALFDRALHLTSQYDESALLYLVPDMEANERFVRRLKVGDADKKAKWAGLASYWINGRECVVAKSDPAKRLDCAVRQFIANRQGAFTRLAWSPPWFDEGAGMYLAYRLLGTRLTAFVSVGDYSDEGVSRQVADVDADWVQIARKMVDKGFALDVPMLISLPQNSMSKDDGLLAFALSAYVIEGRPRDAASFLAALKEENTNQHQAMAAAFGVDAEGLQYRFVRWLREIPAK